MEQQQQQQQEVAEVVVQHGWRAREGDLLSPQVRVKTTQEVKTRNIRATARVKSLVRSCSASTLCGGARCHHDSPLLPQSRRTRTRHTPNPTPQIPGLPPLRIGRVFGSGFLAQNRIHQLLDAASDRPAGLVLKICSSSAAPRRSLAHEAVIYKCVVLLYVGRLPQLVWGVVLKGRSSGALPQQRGACMEVVDEQAGSGPRFPDPCASSPSISSPLSNPVSPAPSTRDLALLAAKYGPAVGTLFLHARAVLLRGNDRSIAGLVIEKANGLPVDKRVRCYQPLGGGGCGLSGGGR